MAVGTGRTRISITLGNAVLEKLDQYCAQSGLTRSAVIGDLVGTNLGVFERITSAFEKELAKQMVVSAQQEAEQ